MSDISAAQVKELRERTGAGMMDCKKALADTSGEIEEAVQWLRSKGLAAAAKKSGRIAAEGLVAAESTGTKGVVVEVNSETDFVARNQGFQELVGNIAKAALFAGGETEATGKSIYPGSSVTVIETVREMVGTIGESLSFRRSAGLELKEGVVVPYIHNAVGPGMGKIAVLVALQSVGDQGKLKALGKQLAMHIAATAPQAVSIEGLDPEVVVKEREIYAQQAREEGKPDNIVEKMVEGRLRKFYGESVLLEQVFVIDNETRVFKVLENAVQDVGAPISITGFLRFALGEGLEKRGDDFAAEVAAVQKG